MIEARFRHRAMAPQAAQGFHLEVSACLRAIAWLWNAPQADLVFESRGECAACDLTPYLREGIRGAISYSVRYPDGMQDKAIFDDVLTLQIDEVSVDYERFVQGVFDRIVVCFNAYRANIVCDLDLDLDDYDKIVEQSQLSGKDVDGRDSVFRIHPVNFFDRDLCERAFRHSVDDVANRLCNEVEQVAARAGGLLLIVTSDRVGREDLKAIHDHVASLLDLDSEVPT